ncbi:MAG TPA: hypothetical protein PLK04_01675 [Bacillota bacterium]|nr:hypothetical protein [Bacillota bacterium]
MKLPDINIKVVLASVAVAAVLLFGGREVFLRTSVAMPMDRAFASMSEIESYSFERSAYGAVVEVKLGNVEDLSETVRKVEAAVAKVPADGRLWVRISDTRDVLLQDVYYRMHFDIEEAIATGSFSDLKRRADEKAWQAGLSGCVVQVDADNVYVSLENGEHRLYAVVSRASGAVQGGTVVRSDARWLSTCSPRGKAGVGR